MNLQVDLGKIKLKNPIMVASGTFGYAKEFEGLVDFKKLGAIVTKTITFLPRQGNPMPRICETASGMLNSIGLQNEGIENFIEEKLPYLSKLGAPIVVSISGNSIEEFCKLARIIDKEKSVSAIELNISCPNIKGKGLISQDKEATRKLVEKVRKIVTKFLITKLSPNVTDIVEIAQAACEGGTDAVSLVNTFFGMAIDIEERKPKLGNIIGGLSGPAIKPMALKMVYDTAKAVRVPVIGIGGIMSAEDVIEFMLAGATAVEIGTGNFVEPDISVKVLKGIESYLERHKIKNISDIIGKLKC